MGTVVDFPPAPAAAPALVLSAPIRTLMAATEALAAQTPAEMPGPQALAETQILLAELDRLKAVALARVADVDRRGLAELDGAPSTASWVAQQQTGMDRGDVALARRLDRYPLLAQRVFDGLPLESAQKIGAALTKLRPHLDRPDGLLDGQPADLVIASVICNGVRDLVCEARGGMDDTDPRLDQLIAELAGIAGRADTGLSRLEAAFLVLAREIEPALLHSALERLVDACLPQQLEDAADQADRDRQLQLTRNYGGAGWTVSGQLDTECGEMLHTVLTAELATDPDNPVDTAAWSALRETGAETEEIVELDGCAGAPRSMRQRRHDGLKTALRRLLDSGALGRRGGHVPHIAVTVSLDGLHGAPGALPAIGDSGQPLPASLVQRWLCDSEITRFLLSLGRRAIEASHTERTLKRHERRAKRIETGGRCQGAGCTRGPGEHLIPHHVIPWSVCGTTSLTDTVWFCPQTHHDLHTGGKTIRLKDGRYLNEHGWTDGPDR
jgi:hypothetical protein